MGRGRGPSETKRAVYREIYSRAYASRRAEAVAEGFSRGMADHVAEVHADAVAIRESGLVDPSRSERIVY